MGESLGERISAARDARLAAAGFASQADVNVLAWLLAETRYNLEQSDQNKHTP